MKAYTIVATFPELLVKHHTQVITIRAGRMSLAIMRGLDVIRKRDAIKGRRITRVQVAAVLVKEQKEETA